MDGSLIVDPTTNSFKIEACATYIEDNNVATIQLFSLIQPNFEKATDSVKIRIDTVNDEYVAKIEEGVTFTPFRGEVQVETSATNLIVQEKTDVIFELVPQHAILIKDEPEILIEFPPELKISSAQCQISDVELTNSEGEIDPSCFRFQ